MPMPDFEYDLENKELSVPLVKIPFSMQIDVTVRPLNDTDPDTGRPLSELTTAVSFLEDFMEHKKLFREYLTHDEKIRIIRILEAAKKNIHSYPEQSPT